MVSTDADRHSLSCSPSDEDMCFINAYLTALSSEVVCKIDFGSLTTWDCEDVSNSNNVAVAGLGATGDETVIVFAFDQTTTSTVDYNVYLMEFSGPSVTWAMSATSSGKKFQQIEP